MAEVTHLWDTGQFLLTLGQWLHTFLQYVLGEIILLECKLHKNKDLSILFTALSPAPTTMYDTLKVFSQYQLKEGMSF